MAPRFSILLPTHDRADVISYSIRSALRQTDPDFEILLVCDGCTPETAEVVRSFDDGRIRFFELPKAPGFGWANRNMALREAGGELIAFLGDDDILLPDHLEQFSRTFEDERVEWAYSRPLWMADDGVAVPVAVDLRRPSEFERFMTVGNSVPPSCVVHRRSALERYGYWPDDLWKGEASSAIDWELWRRMVGPSGGANIGYIPVPTSIHFRARWRDPQSWVIPGLGAWIECARSEWWPAGLRLALPEGSCPQEAAWEKLARDADGWVRSIRSGVVTVIDGFAWEAAAEQQRGAEQAARTRALEQALAEESVRTADLERALAAQRRLSDSILSSRSWRLMAPARRVGRSLRDMARLLRQWR